MENQLDILNEQEVNSLFIKYEDKKKLQEIFLICLVTSKPF